MTTAADTTLIITDLKPSDLDKPIVDGEEENVFSDDEKRNCGTRDIGSCKILSLEI